VYVEGRYLEAFMADHHHPVEADPRQVEQAEALFGNFTAAVGYIIVAIAVLLLGMAFFLVH
jgi:hypothetical protein